MKFEINRSYLSIQINKNLKISSYKNDIPYFNGIFFEVLANKIIITTSDGITSIKNTLSNNLKVIEQGSFLVDRKYLGLILRKIDDNLITISEKDNLILIKGKKFTSTINCMDKKSYPKNLFQNENWTGVISINAFSLYESIKKCKFLINRNEKHSALTGINLKSDLKLNQLVFSATDSFRIAQVKRIAKFEFFDMQMKSDIDIIIPYNFIDVLEKLLSENYLSSNKNQDIKLLYNKNKMQFVQDYALSSQESDQVLLQSHLINDSFPNTIKMIANQEVKKCSEILIKKSVLEKVVDRVSLLSNTFDDNIIQIKVDQNLIDISSTVSETGSSDEKIVSKNLETKEENYSFKGKNQKISVNSNYFASALKAFSENNEVRIKIFDLDQPLIIENKDNIDHIQLILPIQVY